MDANILRERALTAGWMVYSLRLSGEECCWRVLLGCVKGRAGGAEDEQPESDDDDNDDEH
jgi:hypothetical protein